MVLHEPKDITQKPLILEDVPIPEPAAGQIRIKVSACGVCHTDLHTVEGDLALPKLPLIPGHEIVGVVDKLGAGVAKFRPGDKAGAVWLYRTCGHCAYCRSGRENLCENAMFTGYHVDGGYAEYMVVDEAFAYHLPLNLPDPELSPLMCGGVIGYRAFVLSEARPGQVLGLYGFGNSAHITIQVARHLDIRVFVFTRSPGHQQHALELGAEWVGRAEETPPEGIDSAIIFAPAGPLVPEALRVLNPGGTVAMAGIYMTPIPEMPYDLLYFEHTLRSVANSTRQDVIDLLKLAGEIPIHTTVVTYPLEEANEVLLAMKESRINGDAVLIP
jgi:propanol-preferring alcohol dehydrogenase